jgi:hypothetical protein
MGPGAAKVAPFKLLALRFGTLVVLATTKGAVPVDCVEVICPENVPVVVLTGAFSLPLPSVCRITLVPIVPVALLDVTVEADPAIGIWVEVIPLSGNAVSTRLPLPSHVPRSPVVFVPLVEDTILVPPLVPVVGRLEPIDVAPAAIGTWLAVIPERPLPAGQLVVTNWLLAFNAIPAEQVPEPSPVAVIAPPATSVVKFPLPGVAEPIAPGLANVPPFSMLALRLGTLVVLATENGAVPVPNVEVICPLTVTVVVFTGALALPDESLSSNCDTPVVPYGILVLIVVAPFATGIPPVVIPVIPLGGVPSTSWLAPFKPSQFAKLTEPLESPLAVIAPVADSVEALTAAGDVPPSAGGEAK